VKRSLRLLAQTDTCRLRDPHARTRSMTRMRTFQEQSDASVKLPGAGRPQGRAARVRKATATGRDARPQCERYLVESFRDARDARVQIKVDPAPVSDRVVGRTGPTHRARLCSGPDRHVVAINRSDAPSDRAGGQIGAPVHEPVHWNSIGGDSSCPWFKGIG
jgi:hypothetical protein